MKRLVQRWLRRRRLRLHALPRLQSLRDELETVVGPDLKFVPGGGRGQDFICQVWREGTPRAVLRIAGPGEPRSLPPDSPFVALTAQEKIRRESEAYRLGGPLGLTPQLLWQSEDANLCAYCSPGRSLMDSFTIRQVPAWILLGRVTDRLVELHAAGLTHLDISLHNILETDSGLVFVDFEYGPAPGLGTEEQRLYDHLRLIESTYKFLTPAERSEGHDWFAHFANRVPAVIRQTPLDRLRPALGRLLADPVLASPLHRALST